MSGSRPRKPLGLWPVWSLVPFGWLTFVGFAIAAARLRRRRRYVVGAVVWCALTVAFFVFFDAMERVDDDFNGTVGIVMYAAGILHSLLERPGYVRRKAEEQGGVSGEEAARLRVEERRRSQELARTDPVVALEMGLGRPELGGAHGEVVDVNHADVAGIATIPCVDRALAERIARTRDELNGFASAAELATTLDLPPHLYDDLERHTIYLPRD